MTLRPLHDHVLIEPEPEVDYTEAMGFTHVIAPEVFRTGPIDLAKWGTVMALGHTCTSPVKVGQRVLYGKFGWAKVDLGEGKYLALVREGDIIAICAQ